MCRMFGFKGSSLLANKLQNSLINAARSDYFSKNRISHDDGWGSVWYSKESQFLLRSRIPIFKDKRAVKFFPNNTTAICALSHARKAAPNEPIRGSFDSHPFSTHAGEDLVYVAHNGHIDKSKLIARLELDTSKLNDTEAFTFLLEKMTGNVETRLKSSIDFVNESDAMLGALNLFVLSVKRNGEHDLFYFSDFPGGKNDLYYTLYTYSYNRNKAVMSSTVAYVQGLIDRTGEPIKSHVAKVPLRKLRKLR
jgi:predicted glutamine amidotransferase